MCSLYVIYFIVSIIKCSKRANYFTKLLTNARNGYIIQA
nr:MAG TPA: hypothetical protein [Caudoviricetes sp.]